MRTILLITALLLLAGCSTYRSWNEVYDDCMAKAGTHKACLAKADDWYYRQPVYSSGFNCVSPSSGVTWCR